MKKDRELDNIIDECLEKIFRGRTVEQCLQDYPDRVAELEPVLRTIVEARSATDIRPRSEFRDRARHEFQAAIRELEPVSAGRGFFPRFKPVWVAVSALIALLIVGSGTVYAASGALPDSPLYGIKLATETVWLALTPSDIGKAELNTKFADRRVEEIVQMADKGKVEYAQEATEKLERNLVAVVNFTLMDDGEAPGGKALTYEAAEIAPDRDGMLGTSDASPAEVPEPQSPPPEDSQPVAAVRPTDTEATQVAPEDTALSANAIERSEDEWVADEAAADDREERLRQKLLEQAIENPEALEKALETATDTMREIIEWALEVASESYNEAIDNLR